MLGNLLAGRASTHRDKEAIVCGKDRLTYGQLFGRASVISHNLKSLDIRPGDIVAMYVPSGIDCVAAFCGVLALGAVVVPIDPQCKPAEIKEILRDLQPKALIVHTDLAPASFAALPWIESLQSVLLIATEPKDPLPALATTLTLRDINWNYTRFGRFPPANLHTDELPAVIFYTSGSTGKPKGVVHTHRSFLASMYARLGRCDVGEQDRILSVLPMNSALEFSAIIMTSIASGATLLVLPHCDVDRDSFAVREALELIAAERITVLPGVPAIFQKLLQELDLSEAFDFSSVRLCWSSSGAVPESIVQAAERHFNVPLLVFYGMTEFCGPFLLNASNMPRKTGSVGTPAPGFNVKILDRNGHTLPRGRTNIGEISAKGPSIMSGYYGQPERTSAVLKDGWLLTGDLGCMDEDGHIFVLGRKDDQINCGGAKVYPPEVEATIMRFPGIRETAVVGVACPNMGERVRALIVRSNPSITEVMLKRHCEQHLAGFKVPRVIDFVESLPRNSRGKVIKRFLKQSDPVTDSQVAP